MSHIFLLFLEKMIIIVFIILTILIKDLKMYLRNSNLPIGKNAICFEFLAFKKETNKQTAISLYYKYWESIYKSIYLFRKNVGQNALLHQYQIVSILKKQVIKQAVELEKREKF